MKTLILSLVAYALQLSAQTTVFKQVFTNQSTIAASTAIANASVMSSHILRATTISDAQCLVDIVDNGVIISLDGSYDNTTWFVIGVPITQLVEGESTKFSTIRIFSGNFPFIRVNLIAGSVNCAYSVSYTGIKNAALLPESIPAEFNGFRTAVIDNLPAAPTLKTIVDVPNQVLSVVVYGIVITTGGLTTITDGLFQGQTVGTYRTGSISSNQTLGLNPTKIAYFSVGKGEALRFGTTTACGDCVMNVVYRLE